MKKIKLLLATVREKSEEEEEDRMLRNDGNSHGHLATQTDLSQPSEEEDSPRQQAFKSPSCLPGKGTRKYVSEIEPFPPPPHLHPRNNKHRNQYDDQISDDDATTTSTPKKTFGSSADIDEMLLGQPLANNPINPNIASRPLPARTPTDLGSYPGSPITTVRQLRWPRPNATQQTRIRLALLNYLQRSELDRPSSGIASLVSDCQNIKAESRRFGEMQTILIHEKYLAVANGNSSDSEEEHLHYASKNGLIGNTETFCNDILRTLGIEVPGLAGLRFFCILQSRVRENSTRFSLVCIPAPRPSQSIRHNFYNPM
jgi:hypothetical protein